MPPFLLRNLTMFSRNIYKALLACWVLTLLFSSQAGAVDPSFTPKEKEWLKNHPSISIAPDPDSAPIEWFSIEGTLLGLSADYIKLLEKRLGIHFKIVHAENWQKVIEMAKKGEIDTLSAVAESPQRLDYLLFSSPHIIVPGVIISAKSYKNIEELLGKKVAVVADYIWDDLLTIHKTDVRLVRVEDVKTGMELTAMGAVDAMVGDLATTTNSIHRGGLTNLHIVSYLEQKLELGFAVRKDWPEFVQILDKTLASISKEEKDVIATKWLTLGVPPWWKDRDLRLAVGGAAGVAVLVILLFVGWNRTLSSRVAARTRALKKAQKQLVRAARLESVGQLAAGVAHEVKNPLAIIQMGVDYLGQKNTTRDQITGEILVDMADAVKRADTVILGLLDYARDSEITKKKGNINRVIERSLHLVGHELQKREIHLVTRLSDEIPPLSMDVNKIQQVFINLFINASHAMEDGGALKVITQVSLFETTGSKATQFTPNERVIRIDIIDTGSGLKEEDLDRVMDPFFTTKPIGQGTGLGLSVCSNIIDMHNGAFILENHAIKGATAQIILPYPQENIKS